LVFFPPFPSTADRRRPNTKAYKAAIPLFFFPFFFPSFSRRVFFSPAPFVPTKQGVADHRSCRTYASRKFSPLPPFSVTSSLIQATRGIAKRAPSSPPSSFFFSCFYTWRSRATHRHQETRPLLLFSPTLLQVSLGQLCTSGTPVRLLLTSLIFSLDPFFFFSPSSRPPRSRPPTNEHFFLFFFFLFLLFPL